jgi:hypothetical protein
MEEQEQLSKEQMAELIKAMDTILTILGAPSLTTLLATQEELFSFIAPEKRNEIMEQIQNRVVMSFSKAVEQNSSLMQSQLQQAIDKNKK